MRLSERGRLAGDETLPKHRRNAGELEPRATWITHNPRTAIDWDKWGNLRWPRVSWPKRLFSYSIDTTYLVTFLFPASGSVVEISIEFLPQCLIDAKMVDPFLSIVFVEWV